MFQAYHLIKPIGFYTSESSCKRAQNTRISFVILYIYSRFLLKHVWWEYIAGNNILSPHILHNFKHCFLTNESEKLKYIIHCSWNGRRRDYLEFTPNLEPEEEPAKVWSVCVGILQVPSSEQLNIPYCTFSYFSRINSKIWLVRIVWENIEKHLEKISQIQKSWHKVKTV